jgi:type VI secretion system secreted protein VgrG
MVITICRIDYFFEHENGKHTLVFADAPDKHKPHIVGAKETVTFQKTIGVALDREVITAMQQHKKLTTGSYTARDYNFTIPDTDLTVSRTAGPDGQGEWYEYPGGYEKTNNRGQTLAKVRMEACDVRFHILQGRSNVRGFRAGSRFILDKHPTTSLNGQSYVFTRIRHEAIQQLATGNSSGDSYTNFFSCFPHKVPFRPLRGTGKPLIVSSQTAIVTGTAYAHDQAAVHPTLACPPVCVVLEHW